MAAVTGVITAVAGLGMAAYKMYDANEKQQDADEAAKKAAQNIRNIKETNEFDSLQAPDVSRLAQEQNAANAANSVAALQGMGAEGAAQIAKVEQVAKENNLKTAESQAKINYQRDIGVASNAAQIEARRAEREGTLELSKLTGAQLASSDAAAQKQAAVGEMVQSGGNLATGIGDATSLEAQAQRDANRLDKRNNEFQTIDSSAIKGLGFDPTKSIDNSASITPDSPVGLEGSSNALTPEQENQLKLLLSLKGKY